MKKVFVFVVVQLTALAVFAQSDTTKIEQYCPDDCLFLTSYRPSMR